MNLENVKHLIELAIEEDIGKGDITTDNIIPEHKIARAKIISEEDGVICGIEIAKLVCEMVDEKLNFNSLVEDGEIVKSKQDIAHIIGPARSIISSERIILNFLNMLSGIASCTRKYVDKVKPYNVKILDTRKTIPGYRMLEKYAVKIGGAENHRIGLYDMVLIKDNHIAVAGSLTQAVESVRGRVESNIKVEVETENLSQVKEAVLAQVDRIMLDNMSNEVMNEAVKLIGSTIETEASGGITLDNIEGVAKTGVDYISIGAVTHSYSALNLKMDIKIDEV